MTQTNCPECDSSRIQYRKNYGYWQCQDCCYVWVLDKDDPDYEESMIDDTTLRYYIGAELDNMDLCSKCYGGGLIQVDGEMRCCPKCNGDGRSQGV
ncbi:hypothetical protein NIES25_44040 [Nostoc linckia NIES-25]|nr:hypothetical protein NIES25_44040 [Nostoc linckia NIES-25]